MNSPALNGRALDEQAPACAGEEPDHYLVLAREGGDLHYSSTGVQSRVHFRTDNLQ